jgi:hypothetical protein
MAAHLDVLLLAHAGHNVEIRLVTGIDDDLGDVLQPPQAGQNVPHLN